MVMDRDEEVFAQKKLSFLDGDSVIFVIPDWELEDQEEIFGVFIQFGESGFRHAILDVEGVEFEGGLEIFGVFVIHGGDVHPLDCFVFDGFSHF